MSRRLIGAVLAVALSAGCGSTVQVQGTAGVPEGGGLVVPSGPAGQDGGSAGLGGSTTGASLPGYGSGGTTGEVGSPTTSGSSGGSTASSTGSVPASGADGGTGAGPGTGGLPSGPATGRGFTKTTVYIGVGTADDANAFAGSFGLKGVGYSGDPNVWFKAAVDDINKRGGLLGRRIELVKHDYNTAELLNSPASAHQKACTTWTQDRPVFAVLLAGLLVENTLLACLDKTKTPLVAPSASQDYPLHYQQTYQRFPLFFNLAQMVGERFDRISIGRLAARGFFDPWDTRAGKPGTAATKTKVGLIGFDDADGAIQQANQQKELARHGLKGDAVVQCPRALSGKIQCEQSAVLKFASNGITHVFGADTIFMNNAQSQGYHPRYFVHVSTAGFAANVGANQLTGAMGEGYVPAYDVELADYPGDPTPATGRCKALMKAAGQVATDSSTLALQLAVCDEFFFTEATVRAAGSLTAAALRAGFESLGSSQPSALTWKSFLGPTEHTSAVALRDLVYRPDIGRFIYASRTNHS